MTKKQPIEAPEGFSVTEANNMSQADVQAVAERLADALHPESDEILADALLLLATMVYDDSEDSRADTYTTVSRAFMAHMADMETALNRYVLARMPSRKGARP